MYELTIPGEPVAKGVKGHDGYVATVDGQIYSIKSQKFLKQTKTKDGYLKVTLWNACKGTTRKTHRFIAETFIDNPLNKSCVNHINGDKEDNRAENLEWVTYKENMEHAVKNKLFTPEKAKQGYKTRLKKYGKEYLSEISRINGSKADRKKANETKLKKYGVKGIAIQAKKASDAALEVTRKKTIIIDIELNKDYSFNSRKEAAEFIKVDPRRISDGIYQDYLVKKRYKIKETLNDD